MTISFVCASVCLLFLLSGQPVRGDGHGIAFDCKPGWELDNGYCYLVVEKPMSHSMARSACSSVSGDLWYGEVDYHSYLYSRVSQTIWTGLHVDGTDYFFNEDLVEIQNIPYWVANQPDVNSGSCVSRNQDGLTLENCENDHQFVCWYPACVQGFKRCAMEKKCVHGEQDICDGINDCEDMSDESHCLSKCRSYQYLETSSGTIVTPLINAYTDCMYTLEAKIGEQIQLTVPSVNLGENVAIIEVFSLDRMSDDRQLKARLTGRVSRQNIYSDRNILILRVTRGSTPAAAISGQRFEWTTVIPSLSGAKDLSAETTYASLHIPTDAPDVYELTWNIQAPAEQVISFNLGLRDSSLMAEDGQFSYRECGYSGDYTNVEMDTYYVTGCNQLTVRLMMDPDKNQNLYLQYRSGCSMTIPVSDGYIRSPGYQSESIPHNLECEWVLDYGSDQSTTQGMIVKFSELDLASDPRDNNKRDTIKVYRNDETEPVTPTMSTVISASTGMMRIRFESNSYLTSSKFNLFFGTDCPPLDLSEETQITPSTTYSDEYVDLACGEGYQFNRQLHNNVNTLRLRCFRNKWFDVNGLEVIVPQCQARYCGAPRELVNGFILNATGSNPGDHARYDCYPGFTFEGDREAECNTDGRWTGTRSCTSGSCVYLSQNIINNGGFTVKEGNDFTQQSSAIRVDYNTVIEFSCDEGYEIIGWPISHCELEDWTHGNSPPTCRILKCPKMEIENAVSGLDETVGSVVNIRCSQGYEGGGSVTCTSDQTYDVIPTCTDIDECTTGANSCDGRTTQCENTLGSYDCLCLTGFQRSSTFACTDINECNETPCDHNCIDTEGSFDCTCDAGYEIFASEGMHGFYSTVTSGPSVIDSGDYYQIGYTCVKILCPPLNNPDNGMYMKGTLKEFQAGDSVTLQCDDGYKIAGQSNTATIFTVSCSSSGDWGQQPTCEAKTCPVPTAPNNGAYDKTGTVNFRDTLTLTCTMSTTSDITETRTAICVDQGDGMQFGGDDITVCPEIDCGDPNLVAPAGAPQVSPGSTKHIDSDSTFALICGNRDPVQVECKANGKWSFGAATCTDDQCNDPGTPGDSRQIVETYEVGQTLRYSCIKEGYAPLLNGNDYDYTCELDANGVAQWSNNLSPNNLPTCTDMTDPVITGCPTDALVYFKMERVTLPILNANDNSGYTSLTSNSNLASGDVLLGDYTITYTAEDDAGNTATCTVQIRAIDLTDEKPDLECPLYREIDIDEESKTIIFSDDDSITSSNGELTYNPESLTVDINKLGTSDKVTITATRTNGLKTLTSECNFLVSYPRVTYCDIDLIYRDSNRLTLLSIGDDCTQANSTCKPGYTYRDGTTFKIFTWDAQNGWNYDATDVFCLEYKNPTYAFDVTIRHLIDSFASQCQDNFETALSQSIQTIKNRINAEDNCNGLTWDITPNSPVIEGITTFETTLRFGLADLEVSSARRTACRDVIASTESFFGISGLVCPGVDGTVVVTANSVAAGQGVVGCSDQSYTLTSSTELDQICIPCGPGNYYDITSDSCRECADNQYQAAANQYSCTNCPNEANAEAVNIECMDTCPPGYSSDSGMFPCEPCPIDTYWKDSKTCMACPNDGSTLGLEGVTQLSGCSNPCEAGSSSFTGYEPCTGCPIAFYQSQTGQSVCTECSMDRTTANSASTSGNECIDISPGCTDDYCNGNGVCDLDHHRRYCTCNDRYSGDTCEILHHICNINPCNNGGTCNPGDTPDSYTCSCPVDPSLFRMDNRSLTQNGGGSDSDVQISNAIVSSLTECVEACLENDECEEATYAELNFGKTCILFSQVLDELTDKDSEVSVHMRKNRSYGNLFGGTDCENDIVNECEDAGCHDDSRCMDKVNGFECLCPAGKEGELCMQVADLCVPDPCGNHGDCINYDGVSYECTCDPGYTGFNCETDINECEFHADACLNDGECVHSVNSYSCRCVDDYTGDHCEIPPNFCAGVDCLGDNICFSTVYNRNGLCFCDSEYFDLQNDRCVARETPCDEDPPPCGVHGTCSPTGVYNSYGVTCACDSGYTGSRCQSPIDYCVGKACNHGNCINGADSAQCECDAGYEGDSCNNDIDDCDGIDCNNGQCEDQVNGYVCNCQTGYTGEHCETNIDDCYTYPCQHDGTCEDGVDTYTCNCATGWLGTNCEIPNNQRCTPNPCNGDECYSTLTNYFCICEGGSQGDNCEEQRSTCRILANNFDLCVNGYCRNDGASASCSCTTDYDPRKCSFDDGTSDMENHFSKPILESRFETTSVEDCQELCLNNENCAALSLNAQSYCFLHRAEDLDPRPSPGSTFYTRTCPSHYSGDSCEFVKDWCSQDNNPCSDNGNCVRLYPIGYRCDCMEGYTGSQCEVAIDPCASNPCGVSSNVNCWSENNAYICTCDQGKPLANGICTDALNFVILVHNLEGRAPRTHLQTPFPFNSNMLSLMMWFKLHDSTANFKLFSLIGSNSLDPNDENDVFKIDVVESGIVVDYHGTQHSLLFDDVNIPDLYDTNWHLLGIAIDGNGQLSFYINSIKASEQIELGDDFNLENIFIQLYLGEKDVAEYEDVRVWDTYIEDGDFTDEFLGQLAPNVLPVKDWSNYHIAPGSWLLQERLQDTYTTDESKVPPTLDCEAALFDQSMSVVAPNKYLSVVPEFERNFEALKNVNNQLDYQNNQPEYFEWGLYNMVVLGLDSSTERYGECRFPLFVKYNDECPQFIKHDTSLTTSGCFENSGVCGFSCNDPLKMISSPFPRQAPCTSLGVYDQRFPYRDLVLPTCTVFSDKKYIVQVKLVYSFSEDVNCAALNNLGTVEARIEQDLQDANAAWQNFCDTSGSSCSNMIFHEAECSSSVTHQFDVEFSMFFNDRQLFTLPPTVTSMDVEDVFRSLILEEEQFELSNLGSAMLVDSKVELTIVEGCGTPGNTLLYRPDSQNWICAPCGKGYHVDSETMVCTICEMGTYQNMENENSCTPCDTGSTNYQPGEVDADSCIEVCPKGEFYNGNSCEECGRHRYQSEAGKNFCNFCGYGYKTAKTGADSPDDCGEDCPAGQYGTSPQCENCPRGKWRSQDYDDCQDCDSGWTTMEGELAKTKQDCKMEICELGEYWSTEDSECIPCANGYFQDELLALECKKCDGNLTTHEMKSISEDDCTFYCADGYQVLDADARTCKACDRGAYKTNEEDAKFGLCLSCTGATTDGIASTLETDCNVPICTAGEHIVTSDCEDCPLDTYSEVDDPYTTTRCSPCTNPQCNLEMEMCHLYGTRQTGADNSTLCERYCEPGKELVDGTCRMCKRGYYKDNQGNTRFEMCKPCSTDHSIITDGEGTDSFDGCNKPNCTAGQKIVLEDAEYVCRDCAVDTYQELKSPTSTVECIACPNIGDTSQGTLSEKSTNVEACMPICAGGQEYDDDTEMCVDCPISQYKETSDRFGECANCTEGYVAPETGVTSINDCTLRDCPPGTKIDGDQCEPCPVCTWQDERRQTTCNPCGTDLCTQTEGTQSEDECTIRCEAGFEGTVTCEPCKDHFYKPAASFGGCIACEEGTTSSPEDRTACNLLYCHYGRELQTNINGEETCAPCGDGFYKDVLGNDDPCLPCEASYTTIFPGQRECTERDCLPGTTLNGDNCDPCDEGTYKSEQGNMACTDCPASTTTDGRGKTRETDCNIAICPAGRYRSADQPSVCLECAVNSFQPDTGATTCTGCESGFITLEPGAASEDKCVPLCLRGQQYNPDTEECDPCPQGYYKSEIGNIAQCTRCQDGRTTVGAGSQSQSACDQTLCNMGEYGVAENNRIVCYPCSIGYFNPEMGQSQCTICPSGKSTIRDGRISDTDCRDTCQPGFGLSGRLKQCALCEPGKYNNAVQGNEPFYCKLCPSGFTSTEPGSSECPLETTDEPPVVTNKNVVINLVYVVGIASCDEQFVSVVLFNIRTKLVALCEAEQSTRFRNRGRLCGSLSVALALVNPCAPAKRKKRADFNLNVAATFSNVSATITNPDTNAGIAVEDALTEMLDQNDESLSTTGIAYVGYDGDSIRLTEVCLPGTVLDGTECRPCAMGTYWEDATCKECGTDTYQNETQQTTCKPCPDLTHTDLRGQTSVASCLSFCSANPSHCNLRGSCTTTGRRTGSCSCFEGYQGNRCQSKSDPDSDMDLILGLAIGGGGGLLLIILAIVGIYRYMSVKDKKKYKKKQQRREDMDFYQDPMYDNHQRQNYGLPHFQSVGYPALGYRPDQGGMDEPPYSTVYKKRPSATMDRSYDNDTFVWQA